MYCIHCGSKNDKDSKHCIECGENLNNSAENTEHSTQKKTEDILFIPPKKSHTLRNILLVLVVIGVLFALLIAVLSSESTTSSSNSTEEYSDWQPFTSVEHNFIVDFPTYPESERSFDETTDGIAYSYTQYLSENGSDTYLAQVADYDIYPEDYDNKTGLEGFVNGLLDGEGMTIDRSRFTNFRGYDAIEFTFTLEDDTSEYYGKGIAFIKDDLSTIKAFLLMSLSEYREIPNYERFINSFIIN